MKRSRNGEKRRAYRVQRRTYIVNVALVVIVKHERIVQKYQKTRVIFSSSIFLHLYICMFVAGCDCCNECVLPSKSENERVFSHYFKGDVSLSAVPTSPTVTNLCCAKKYLGTMNKCVKVLLKHLNGSFFRAHRRHLR